MCLEQLWFSAQEARADGVEYRRSPESLYTLAFGDAATTIFLIRRLKTAAGEILGEDALSSL
jgi:hypothetical protein